MPDDARPAGGSPAPADHEQLTRLGKYVIQRKLGSGGMGTVFLAQDSDLKRTVALKVLAKEKAENPVLVRRFKAEGQAAAYLQHKNIVGVYDSGQIDGFLYIALEYVEGQDVLEIIRKRGVIPVRRSIEIMRQVADALEHAYEKQIVHRDIKPSNLLIKNDGTVKLADLGLARSIDETLDTSITRVGTTVGTVDYMSPEQARNSKATDIRSDIYSLGCTWYHMLTGAPPFPEGSVTNKLQAHAVKPPPDPRDKNDRIPEGIVAVLHRMMAKSPADRYQTPAELLVDLNNPLISRGGLNADVLSALASPRGQGGDAGANADALAEDDLFVRRNVADDKAREVDDDDDDGPAIRKATPRSKRPAPDWADDDPETEAPTGDTGNRPRRPLPGAKPDKPSKGKAPARQTPDRDEPTPSGPNKLKPKKGLDPEKSGPMPRRASQTERETARDSKGTEEDRKERFKSRKLPPRQSGSSDSQPVQMSLDPDRIRSIVIGGIVLLALVGIAFAFSKMGGGPAPVPIVPGDLNPPEQPQQQPVAQQPTPPPQTAPEESPKSIAAGETSDATTQLRKTAEPIAGAEDLTNLNSQAAREYIPNWLFQVRRAPAVNAPAPVSVRRPGTPGEGVPTLAEALKKLPPGEAIMELDGDGPFFVAPLELPARPHLTLRAKSGSHPVLVVATSGLKAGEAAIRAAGPLTISGVHLVLSAAPDLTGAVSMIRAASLSLRDCTLTTAGAPPAGSALIEVDGQSSAGSLGCVLEACHAHAESTSVVKLVGSGAHFLAGASFLATAKAPTVVIEGGLTAGGQSDRRMITLLKSTLASGSSAFAATLTLKEPATPLQFVSRRSVYLAPSPKNAFIETTNWPVSPADLSNQPVALGMSWKADQTTIAGWPIVARMASAANPVEFEGDSGWQKFWRINPPRTRIDVAPRELPPGFAVASAASIPPSLNAPGDAGVNFTALPVAPAGLVDRVVALTNRRRLPADFIAFREPTATVEFDLTTKNSNGLNALLNDSAKCPDGALVKLKGVGIKAIAPLELNRRTLHIEFVQMDGALLSIRPQSSASTEPLVTIQGGHVEITGLRVIPPERQFTPYTAIEAFDANVSLQRCSLQGTSEESAKSPPIVKWTSSSPASGAFLIQDSYLAGSRVAVEANLADRLLVIDNSIIASNGDALSLQIAEASRPGTLVFNSSTAAARQRLFHIPALPPGPAPALSVFISDSIATAVKTAAPALVAFDAPADAGRVAWWEDGLGRSPPVSRDAIPSKVANPAAAVRILRPCVEGYAVLFVSPIEDLSKPPDATSFRLNPNCEAARWGDDGGPLGVHGAVGAPTEVPSAPESPMKTMPARPQKRPTSIF